MSYFSTSYSEAKSQFIAASKKHGGRLWSHPIDAVGPEGETLSIDVCRIGSETASKLCIVSSGTHGVEGFFGSAVQVACLKNKVNLSPNTALLMIHAVNPYGFAHYRRVNEDNVDLNRNFLLQGSVYSGAHPSYTKFNALLNREAPPKGTEFFLLRALYNIAIYGLPNLKNAIAQGQYDYPKGIFYGGKKAARSKEIIATNLQGWIGEAKKVIHLDLHTGLGRSGTYVLGQCGHQSDKQQKHWESTFGSGCIQAMDASGELYEIRGEFGTWCQSQFHNIAYSAFLAEFGTYPILKVIQALCYENRATHWSTHANQIQTHRAKLLEIFAPKDPKWRKVVIEKGLKLIDQALLGL